MLTSRSEPTSIPKEVFEEALTALLKKCRATTVSHYTPTAEEFAFFLLAKKFYPKTARRLLRVFAFECSGVAAVFIKKIRKK